MLPCSWYFAASARPVPTAHCAPTIPLPPKKFAERRYLFIRSKQKIEGEKSAHVHGTAFALGAASRTASKFSENTFHGITAAKLSAMITIGSDEVIFFG